MSRRLKHIRVFGLPRGSVALEFALIVPILCILAFGVIDFGRLIYARHVVNEVSLLGGGSVFWRAGEYGYKDIEVAQEATDLLNLLEAAGRSLDFSQDSEVGRIIISKIGAAWKANDSPTIVKQVHQGSLDVSSSIGVGDTLGLSENLYNHLLFNETNQAPDKSEIGVVEVFYKYYPITPLPNFIEGILLKDGDGIIIRSCKAFY
jgi:hypothetical protein